MNAKILIIEDEERLRNNLKELLELSGYTVATAEDGENGIEGMNIIQPDVIICDINMPFMDGFDVLEVLRLYPTLKDIPFIFLTAKTEESDVKKGMELGANEYLFKPVRKPDLLDAIKRCLENRKQSAN
ncbi:MAG TPA: response regulator [Bacteroidia bacterium]|nr:response regulator [Bacteroidia bacterium]HQK98927.1 response regulator [Bacteroidia bacterium]